MPAAKPTAGMELLFSQEIRDRFNSLDTQVLPTEAKTCDVQWWRERAVSFDLHSDYVASYYMQAGVVVSSLAIHSDLRLDIAQLAIVAPRNLIG